MDEEQDEDVGAGGTRREVLAPASGRLDKVLAAALPDLSRARLQALIGLGQVDVDGKTASSAALKVTAGAALVVVVPPAGDALPEAESIPLDILHEDDALLVLNKPAGLVVHPAPGHASGTLVNALLAHCGGSLSGIGGVRRPGIVHRLDRDTSGLMVVAKHDRAHRALAAQLAGRKLSRTYRALVWGLPSPTSGRIDAPIGRDPANRLKQAVIEGGRQARTDYRTLAVFAAPDQPMLAAEILCRLETGRTHQIRVHCAHAGWPIIGDPLYHRAEMGRRLQALPAPARQKIEAFRRQALHAAGLAFNHPVTGESLNFACEPPSDFNDLHQTLARVA